MRYLVLSDLHERHKNLLGFVDQAHRYGGYDQLLFLGDAIGHREQCAACDIEQTLITLKRLEAVCVRGNWEQWLLVENPDDAPHSQPHRDMLEALRQHLTEEMWRYIESWEWRETVGKFTLAHGSPYKALVGPDDAAPWETYLRGSDTDLVRRGFDRGHVLTSHLLFGHTHEPGYFHYNGSFPKHYPLDPIQVGTWSVMDPGIRYALNPGSAAYNTNQATPWPTALLIDVQQSAFCYLRLFDTP